MRAAHPDEPCLFSPQHAVSQEALEYLEAQTDAQGRPIQVVKLPVPPPLHYSTEEAAGVTQVLDRWSIDCGCRIHGR